MVIIDKIRRLLKVWPRLKLRIGRRTIRLSPAQQYSLAAYLILLGTTLVWAINGARIQLANADQLVNSYLFENLQTFQGSLLPAQHTFLIKWPLFWLMSALHFASWAFVGVTVGLVLLSVGGLVYVLRRIERRPAVLGTLCLALASTLAMIPIHPRTGAQLPVNMAMITTRNIEYILYVGVLGLFLTARRPVAKAWRFWLASGLLTLLVVSDRLFLTLSVGGAILLGLVYVCLRQWTMVRMALQWLAMSTIALIASTGIVWALNATHIVHVIASSDNVWGSYGLAASAGKVLHGLAYAVLSIFTNFGANPFYDNNTKDIPAHLIGLLSVQGLAYLVNLLVLIAVGVASVQILRKSTGPKLRAHVRLAVMLLFSTFASMVAFTASDHYYPVDARYEGIVIFAGFVALASYLSLQKARFFKRWLTTAGVVLLIGVAASCIGSYQLYTHERDAQATLTAQDLKVAQALTARNDTVLLGDYWRVMPIKQAMNGKKLTVVPLGGCTQLRDMLSSKSWQRIDLQHTAFAYLLTIDRPDPEFPQCSLDQIIKAYGRPNASTVIAGSLSQPAGTLLYYDYGANHVPLSASPTKKELSTVNPIDIKQFNTLSPPPASCDGKMIVNIVAHQDDDLLFMNPDIIHELHGGECIRTVYVTAGDDGRNELYWLSRQTGAERAYGTMLGIQPVWTQTIVQLADKQFITLANPIGYPNVGLIFLNLPDGNVNGGGFAATRFESISKLTTGTISKIYSVDGQSEYNADELVQALTTVLQRYNPHLIQTQTAQNMSKLYPDHSDHLTVGAITQKAEERYEKDGAKPQIKRYVGYPIHARPENVFGEDLDGKASAFFSYATSDSSVCSSMRLCGSDTAYGFYLRRQYAE